MRARLVTRRLRGTRWAEQAEVVEPSVLTIGRGTDNGVPLPGLTIALHHATIDLRGGQAHLEPVETNEVVLNGRRVRGARRLSPGDEIGIGPHKLRVTEPEGDEDLRLEIERAPERAEDPTQLARHAEVATEPRWLSRRAASWLLVLGIPLVFVAAPLVTGSQGAWSSGTLSRPHAFFAQDCARCHEVGFQRVRDAACLTCHSRVGHHAGEEIRTAELTGIRCASCHAEHNGHMGLAILEQKACSECHAQLQQRFPGSQVHNASDFRLDHPQFQLALVTDAAREPVEVEWSPDLEERSGLIFNHLRHVGQVVRDLSTGEERNMQCGDCHVADAAGKNMQPIVFERHCQSCHSLNFEELERERQALHGDPAAMRRDLRDFYQGRALRGEVKDASAPAFLRRRAPGRKLVQQEKYEAIEWSNARIREADTHLMAGDGVCAYCHEIRPGAASDGGDDVAPVRVAAVWMPQGEFHHRTHQSFPCRDCHAAAAVFDPGFGPGHPRPAWSLDAPGNDYALSTPEELAAAHGLAPSEHASDVLMPGIEGCNGCHGGAGDEPPLIGSDCVLCHPYHRDELGPMRARSGGASDGMAGRGAAPRGAHAFVSPAEEARP